MLNKILVEPSIELRKLLLISLTRRLYDNRCQAKSADNIPKFSAEDSRRYNSAVTET